MSSEFYERRWRECIRELDEQVYQEGSVTDGPEAFRQLALIYVKYIQLFSRLDEVLDQTIHAQKREVIRSVLEVLMVRITELKSQLVALNPGRPGNKLVALDEVLTDLRLHPEAIEWKFPRFFRQENSDALEIKTKQINHWLATFGKPLEADEIATKAAISASGSKMSLEAAIKVIQRNERGRLGIMRVLNVMSWRKERRDKRISDPQDVEVFRNTAAAKIGAYWRGSISRRAFAKMKEVELAFLGMAPMPEAAGDSSAQVLAANAQERRAKSVAAAEALKQGTEVEKKSLQEAEGPKMHKTMTDERRAWILAVRDATGAYPANVEAFYHRNDPPPEEPVDDKKKKKPEPAKKPDPKKKGEAPPPPPPAEPVGKKTVAELDALLKKFEEVWENRGTTAETFEADIARGTLVAGVEDSVRQTVDFLLDQELANLKKLYDKAAKKKAKGKTKKAKKPKKPKIKKWCAAVGSISNVLDVIPDLVSDNIYKKVRVARLSDFRGSFGLLSSLQRADVYVPPPSYQMIRSNLVEHCMLPLASLTVRQRSPLAVKSLLLYGPQGNGKSNIARTIAHECGAAFFDLSPRNIEGKYNVGKTGSALLIYKVFLAAQELAPAVIYIDDVEEVFLSSKKKKAAAAASTEGASPSEPASRIKKDLIAFMKQIKTGAEATNQDRILFIGSTSRPFAEGVEQKELLGAFEEKVWVNFPDYGSRVQLLLSAVEARGVPKSVVYSPTFNVSVLAKASEGTSVESLKIAVDTVLTERRVRQITNNIRPLEANEFLSALSNLPKCPADEWLKFREFDHDASGERARLAAIKAAQEKAEKEKDPKKSKKK